MPEIITDTTKNNTISTMVDEWLILNDLTRHWFPKYLLVAINGLKELKIDVTGDIIACILPVTDRKTVILPGDYSDFIIVGIPRGQYYIPLAINGRLRKDTRTSNRNDVVAGLLSQNLPNGVSTTDYSGNYFFNYDGACNPDGQLPSKGHFTIQKVGLCKEILLDYDYGFSTLYLEYFNGGFDPNGETMVHDYEQDYLKKVMEFFYEDKNNPKATEASKIRKGRELAAAEKKVRARYNDLTPSTMLAINRTGTRLTPKM